MLVSGCFVTKYMPGTVNRVYSFAIYCYVILQPDVVIPDTSPEVSEDFEDPTIVEETIAKPSEVWMSAIFL